MTFDIGAVMDELATACRTISGLNTAAFPPSTVTTPLAYVSLPPAVKYEATYADGGYEGAADVCPPAIEAKLYVHVLLDMAGTGAGARDTVLAYVNPDGPRSIVAAIERGTYSVDRVVVTTCELGEITYAGAGPYLLASFEVEIGD